MLSLKDRFPETEVQIPNNNGPSVRETLFFMREAHGEQKDHSGEVYETHPFRVAGNLLRIFKDVPEYVVIAAILHDTIEDTAETEETLIARGFLPETVEIVSLVSKPDDDTRSYDQVIDDLIDAGNVWAIAVKLADNMDNMHPERVAKLAETQPDKVAYFDRKYTGSIHKLSNALGLDVDYVLQAIANSPSLQKSENILAGMMKPVSSSGTNSELKHH